MGKSIRMVFSACALVMLIVFGWRVSQGTWSPVNWTMLAISATACLLVFVRFVFIFNFSYAVCAIFNGTLIWIARPGPATALIGGAAIIYGLRLFWFTWARTRSESYASRMQNVAVVDKEMPAPAKLILWFMCSWLMTFHLMALWLAAGRAELSAGIVVGAAMMLTGTLLEGIADWQKQRGKRSAPDRFVVNGLFARWRHPNYLGEILVQAGLMVVAVTCAVTFDDFLAGVISPLYIFILMISESRRVDDYQASRYGTDPVWVDYRDRSGSLFPKL
jgi:steroid 5-alpha reductase family enzyme